LEQWYKHTAEPVTETEKAKIHSDANIKMNHVIEHRQPDTVVIEKDNKPALLIDIAVSRDIRVEEEQEKKWINTRIWHGNSRSIGKEILI